MKTAILMYACFQNFYIYCTYVHLATILGNLFSNSQCNMELKHMELVVGTSFLFVSGALPKSA